MQKMVFDIVESPIAGDPLAPLRAQAGEPAPTTDWVDLLHYHLMRNIQPRAFAQREFREESFQGFALDAFDPKPGDLTRLAQELGAIHDANEDRIHRLPDSFVQDMEREVKKIFGDAASDITVRHFTFDDDGNMVEI